MTRGLDDREVQDADGDADAGSATEQFAVTTLRIWKYPDRLQIRVLSRRGLEPGDEHTTDLVTTDIETAVEHVRSFIIDFLNDDSASVR